VNSSRHQFIDGTLFANNLKNVRRWLEISYEAFDRAFGGDTEVLKDFPAYKPLKRGNYIAEVGADSDGDDFQDGNGGGSCSRSIVAVELR
jgi:hypothetical protein